LVVPRSIPTTFSATTRRGWWAATRRPMDTARALRGLPAKPDTPTA